MTNAASVVHQLFLVHVDPIHAERSHLRYAGALGPRSVVVILCVGALGRKTLSDRVG